MLSAVTIDGVPVGPMRRVSSFSPDRRARAAPILLANSPTVVACCKGMKAFCSMEDTSQQRSVILALLGFFRQTQWAQAAFKIL